MRTYTSHALIMALATLGTPANADLIHANGKVTLVSGALDTAAGSSAISGASDGNISPINNGQVFTTDPGDTHSDYFVAQPGGLVFDIDLGNTMPLYGVSFWNRGDHNGNGVTAFNVVFSTDNIFGNSDDSTVFKFTPTNKKGEVQQNFKLSSVVSRARFARVSITDNDFGATDGGDRIGFTEIQFSSTKSSLPALLQVGGITLCLSPSK